MRYIELELLSTRSLDLVQPPLADIRAFSVPDPEHIVICDRPAGQPRLTCVDAAGARELRLDAPGLQPRLLADTDDALVLAVGGGENSGVLFDTQGRVRRRYNLGEGIVDATFDPDGNIVVLRAKPPLLDRYGPDGDLAADDPQLAAIAEHTEQQEGTLLAIQRDGALWLNLAECYDFKGELIASLDPAVAFGEGRVAADLLGWDGLLVLSESGRVIALRPAGGRRRVRIPLDAVRSQLGREPSAARDVFVTREEELWLLDTAGRKLLTFRILSE